VFVIIVVSIPARTRETRVQFHDSEYSIRVIDFDPSIVELRSRRFCELPDFFYEENTYAASAEFSGSVILISSLKTTFPEAFKLVNFINILF